MKILLKAATILDPQSSFHNKTVDVQIEAGKIKAIGANLKPDKYQIIESEHLHISPGWFDPSVCFGQPGYEEREIIAHGLDVAAASGFTAVGLQPNTNPVLDTHADIAFVKQQAAQKLTALYPFGALTRNSASEDLAELYDMQQAGAIAFGDYKKPIANANLLKVALQYVQGFDGLVCSFPLNDQIRGKGLVNESPATIALGLKGIPNIAESLQVNRDLHILQYVGGRLHIPTISTAESVALIRQAKKDGLKVSCSVAIDNLFFTDEVLGEFDSHFKILPPLRTKKDQKALIDGLEDGTIDMVTSDHNPLDIELKKKEFDYAEYGSIGLETAFGALCQKVSLKTAIRALTTGRSHFQLPDIGIEEGCAANLTFFDPKITIPFTVDQVLSTSKNSPYVGQKLEGKVIGCIQDNKVQIND